MPKLSLVTGTRNRPQSFQRLLRSIVEHTTVKWELIVADASDKCVLSELDDASITVLHENPPLGYVKGYNRAFREATGEWVIWLNDDAEVLPGYDTAAIGFMEAHPKLGLGCLAFSDRCWPKEFRVQSFWGIPYANFGIMRRELGNRIGWFWEGLRMYGSDNSITFDVLLQGYGVGVVKGPLVHHHRVQDEIRAQNESNRREDSLRLTQRYKSHLPRLRASHELMSA